MRFGLALVTILFLSIAGMFAILPSIHAWEKANAYPYGKLCDVFKNCKR